MLRMVIRNVAYITLSRPQLVCTDILKRQILSFDAFRRMRSLVILSFFSSLLCVGKNGSPLHLGDRSCIVFNYVLCFSIQMMVQLG